jgi:hypothetical protein
MDTIGEGQEKRHTKITLRPRKTIKRPNEDCCLPEKKLVPKIRGGYTYIGFRILPVPYRKNYK